MKIAQPTFKLILAATLAVLVCGSCASGDHPPFDPKQPVIRDPVTIEQRLQTAAACSNTLNLARLGQVRYDDFQAPVWIATFTNSTTIESKILVTAGVHGNEPAGVESALRLIEHLARNPDRFGFGVIEIIPLVNPWGWSHDIRFNRQGKDINRDFASFGSQEALIVRDHIQRHQYHLIIDLHEDPDARGFYLYQYGRPDRAAVEPVVAAIAGLGYPVEQDIKMVTLKTRGGIIDAPMWGLWYMKATRQLSLTNYARLYNSPNVFTVETPTVLAWKDRQRIQCRAVEMLMDTFRDRSRP